MFLWWKIHYLNFYLFKRTHIMSSNSSFILTDDRLKGNNIKFTTYFNLTEEKKLYDSLISGPNYIWGQQSFKFTPEISFKFICLDHLGLWCLLVASKWPAQQLFKEQHQCKSTTATAISTTLAAAWLSTAVHLHWWCLIHHKFQWIRQAKLSLLNLIKPNFLSSVQNWKRKYAKVKRV